MPPKGRKGAGDKSKGTEEEQQEDPLQAVVLADAFETRFRPFTLEKPRCLLPLANTPLIEYTLEFLANAGVDEVFIYCGAHTSQLEKYINESKWFSSSSPFSKLEMIRSSSNSIGDAMRDLDKRGILIGDFLVVYGDLVSNLPIEAALAAHRERRTKDKNAIMTMVLREAGTTHRTKAQESRPVFVIDPTKNRCLQFDQMHMLERSRFIDLDPDLLSENQELEIRQDLTDSGIDICTPDALALWSDNFDFEQPRRGFLRSVLKDYELNGKTIHTYIVNDHYASRVRNLHAYDSVSKDLVSRWAYPLCPDSNLLRGQTYRPQKGNIYKEDGVTLARSCMIGRRTVIGKDSSVGEGTVISNSIIGRGCVIGSNITIEGSYIWDNAAIGNGTSVKQAIVGNEAAVGKRCSIEPNALVSYGVHIADGTTVKSSSRITRAKRKREDDEDLERGPPDVLVVGEGGDGFEFVDEDEKEEDYIESLATSGLIYKMSELAISAESISTLNSESDNDFGAPQTGSHRGSFISIASEDSGMSQPAVDFVNDAAGGVLDSLRQNHDSANILLELTSLRMASNASEHHTRKAVITAFSKRIVEVIESGTQVKEAVDSTLAPHKELIRRTMFDHAVSGKVDQIDFLLLLQADLTHRNNGDSILLYTCMKLYDMEVLEQEGLEQWWADVKSSEEDEMEKVRAKTQSFINWLDQDDEESEEDDDEDEDSE